MTASVEKIELGTPVRFTWHLTRRRDWVDQPRGRRFERKLWKVEGYSGQPEPEPRDGIIVGVRTLANGENSGGYGYDDPIVFTATERFRAYLVAYDLRRKPVLVLPKHLKVGTVIDADALAVPESSVRSGAEPPPVVATVMEHIDRRLRWPSMHWGVEGVHPDAWVHIAAAACRGVAAALTERNR